MRLFKLLVICLVAITMNSFNPALSFSDIEEKQWKESCVKKILSFYEGPDLTRENFLEESLQLDFSLYPGGKVRWIHLSQPVYKDQKLKEQSEKGKRATEALRLALGKASPLPVNKNYIQTKRLTGFINFNGYEKGQLIIHVNDYAGFWRARVDNEDEAQKADILKALLYEVKRNKIALKNNAIVYAAVWFYLVPDGTVEGITPVRCTCEKTKRKERLSNVKLIQNKMIDSLKKLDKHRLKEVIGNSEVPLGAILVYRSYRKPGLTIHPYWYYRCPDAVQLFD